MDCTFQPDTAQSMFFTSHQSKTSTSQPIAVQCEGYWVSEADGPRPIYICETNMSEYHNHVEHQCITVMKMLLVENRKCPNIV